MTSTISTASVLRTLTEAGGAPLAEWPARYPGHRAVGYLCSYVPLELIHAAGLVPVRIRGNSAPLKHVDAHLQSFTCALCRSSMDQALNGDPGFLLGVVFAHTCDTMQALADLWRMNSPAASFVEVVMLPANLGSAAARPYLIAELERFRERLAAFVGRPIPDEAVQASIALYDETRRLVQELGRLRGRLSASEFFAVMDAAQAMPREMLNPLLARLVPELKEQTEGRASPAPYSRPRLYLTGAVLDEPHLVQMIIELGAEVIGDDLCSGSRHFNGQVGAGEEPIAALADYFLLRPPCPSKLSPSHDAGQYLIDQAAAAQASGVLFILEKYCEPHAFDYARAIPALRRVGLPYLLVEMEHTPSLEALRTRLEAFVEMVAASPAPLPQ